MLYITFQPTSVLVTWISTVYLLMVCYRWSMICRISLVVTRPLLVLKWSGSALNEFTWALSSSRRVCLLARRAFIGSGFFSASISADCRVLLVGRGSGGPVGPPSVRR